MMAEVAKPMFCKWQLCLLPVSLALCVAGDLSWKDKKVAEWSEEDAKQLLNDSPWVKTVTPTLTRSNDGQRRSGMGQGGRVGMGGIGIGLPGSGGGMGRRGGMGGGQRPPANDDGSGSSSATPQALKLRWESALPVREAELKARETGAPTVDENHYAIAVYGVSNRMTGGDPQTLASQLKKQAALKRDGKKDIKPSSVEVFPGEDGAVIVYLFPRTKEITKDDRRILFDAQIGRLQFAQSFYTEDMVYQGKTEL